MGGSFINVRLCDCQNITMIKSSNLSILNESEEKGDAEKVLKYTETTFII